MPQRQDDDESVILLRLSDPMRAQMLRDLLESDGIPVATPGLEHRAMLGVVGSYVDILLRVPRRDLARATELVAAFDSAAIVDQDGAPADPDAPRDDHEEGGDQEHEGDGLDGDDLAADAPEEDDEAEQGILRDPPPAATTYRESSRGAPVPRPPPPEPRRKMVAAFAAVMFPGAAHVYVRQYRTAALIAVLQVISFVSAVAGVPLGMLLVFLVMLADAIGASWHCDRITRGVDPPSTRRFAVEIALVVVLGWLAFARGPGAGVLAGEHGRFVCDTERVCFDVDEQRCLMDAANARLFGAPLDERAACMRSASDCVEVERCASTY